MVGHYPSKKVMTPCLTKERTYLAKFESHERAFHDRGLPYVYGGVRVQCAMRAYSWRAARVRCAYGARTVRVRCAHGARSVCAVHVRRACGVRAVRARRARCRIRCGGRAIRSSTLRLCGESVCAEMFCFFMFFPHLICLSKYDVFFEFGCAFSRAAAHATTCV